MEPSSRHWLWVRLATIGLSFLLGSWTINKMPGDFSQPSVSFAFIIAGFCAFGVAFVWMLQKINPWASQVWERPSWFANPFSIDAPLQQFHLSGYCLLAAGVGSLLLNVFIAPRSWAWELPFSAGAGVLLGVLLVGGAEGDRDGT